jgi:hypothetical protein
VPANRAAFVVTCLFGVYLLGMQTYLNVGYWYGAGGGSPKPPLYGIWDIEELLIDGEVTIPQANDYDRRWRRVIFDAPAVVLFQRTDDSFARYGAALTSAAGSAGTILLTKGNSRSWKSLFAFERAGPDQLTLRGEMDGHRIELQLRRVDFDTFRLLNSGFRWVRPAE